MNVRRRSLALLALLGAAGVLALTACTRDATTDSGSESHFVRCEVDEDCLIGRCADTYCEHEGRRVRSSGVARTSGDRWVDASMNGENDAGAAAADRDASVGGDAALTWPAPDSTEGTSSEQTTGEPTAGPAMTELDAALPTWPAPDSTEGMSSEQQIEGPTDLVGVPANPAGSASVGDAGASAEFAPESCTTTLPSLTSAERSNETVGIPGASGIFFYSDGVSTLCVAEAAAGRVCVYGVGADAKDDYVNWGAGFGIALASTSPVDQPSVDEPLGVVPKVEPFDATALGIVGVEFTVIGSRGARPHFAMVDEETDLPLEANYIAADRVLSNGTHTIWFDQLGPAPWVLEELQETPFDPTRVNSFEFVMVTISGVLTPYSFCLVDVVWLDAEGNPVVPPQPPTFLEVEAATAALSADAGTSP